MVLLLALLAVQAGGLALSYHLGGQHKHEPIIAQWKQDMVAQRRQIEITRERTRAHMDALAQHIGRLQAHVTRLDALGNRLVKLAELDESEFDFSSAPGLGGPEQSDTQSAVGSADLGIALDKLDEQLDARETQLKVLDQLILSRNLHAEIFPSGRPVRKGWISSRYGKRTNPFSGKREFHAGVDFAGKRGTEVFAVAGGLVTWSGKRSGYGNMVEIHHGMSLVTRYGHNDELLVHVGDTVKKGQVIAKMGTSGRATGPHVHFEVIKDGKHVNPAKYIRGSK